MNSLSFLVKPASYACNLDCLYCFYKRVSSIYDGTTRMSPETADVFIKKSLGAGAAHNSFCWQGGEPTLMGLDFFRQVVDIQKKYTSPGQKVENTIQTNGILLDDEWCSFLREEDILVGISLDGPENIHNRYRKGYNGQGTFSSVMDSIDRMNRNRVKFNILCLLTDANIHEPAALYSFFREHRFNFLQFVSCFEWDRGHEHVTDFSVSGKDTGQFYCDIFDMWMQDGFPWVSIRLFEDILIYLFDRVHVSCCWMESCDSYIVVEHNGDCYPCDFFVYPEWKIGNIREDDLDVILGSSVRKRFASIKSDIPDECSSCDLLHFCRGDCTKFRQSSNERFDRKSEFCDTLKMLISHMEPHLPRIQETVEAVRSGRLSPGGSDTGRNDPCPCGSGKKFKHCCGKSR